MYFRLLLMPFSWGFNPLAKNQYLCNDNLPGSLLKVKTAGRY